MTKFFCSSLALLSPFIFAATQESSVFQNMHVEVSGNLASKTWHTDSNELASRADFDNLNGTGICLGRPFRNPPFSSIYSQFYRHTAIAHQSGLNDPLYNFSIRLVYPLKSSDYITFAGFFGIENGYDRATRTPNGKPVINYAISETTGNDFEADSLQHPHAKAMEAVFPRHIDDEMHIVPGFYFLMHGVGPIYEYHMVDVKIVDPMSVREKAYSDHHHLFGIRLEHTIEVEDIDLLIKLELLSNFKNASVINGESEPEFKAYLKNLSRDIFKDEVFGQGKGVGFPYVDDVHSYVTKVSFGIGIDLSYF